jgi:uncharacterized protein YndB with AHSA1/START domain
MSAANRASSTSSTADREITATRLLDAPRELVFQVWTDPQHVAQWWGPRGFTNTIEKMDVRPGGVWQFVMHGPDGVDYPNRVVFLEVVPPERLVYLHGAERDDEPGQFHVTVTFTAEGKQTRLAMRTVFKTAAERARVIEEVGAIEGLNQTLDRLTEYLARA